MKVLVVDNLATNRKLLRAMLEAEGVTVGEAGDGIAALELLRREKFGAVVSDLLMPQMDGYSLFREIRSDHRLRDLPVIACTSTYLSPEDERLALDCGADRYLTKPVAIESLLRALTELLLPGASRRGNSPLPEDPQTMRDHNIVLAHKLEEKSAELKERNAALGSASNELAESRARYGSILASAMDAIITINETDGIVLFNSAAETMFGASASAMYGKPITNLLRRRSGLGEPTDLKGLMGTGMIGRRTGVFSALSGQHANGAEFPVEGSFSIAEADGKLLFTVILRDISERVQVDEKLRLANEQLRALTARNETIREDERTTIAREIHDVLTQELTCLKIDLVWLARQAASPIGESTRAAMAARLGDAVIQADAAINTVQHIATELRPVVLDSLGLPAAIEWQAEDFGRRSGLTCRARSSHVGAVLSRDCSTAIFRILQECLTNISRHAHATEIDVQLDEEPTGLTLTVSDNGCGITSAQIADAHSIGLVGMRERAQAFDGSVEITGASDAGTTVRVCIPLGRATAHPAP